MHDLHWSLFILHASRVLMGYLYLSEPLNFACYCMSILITPDQAFPVFRTLRPQHFGPYKLLNILVPFEKKIYFMYCLNRYIYKMPYYSLCYFVLYYLKAILMGIMRTFIITRFCSCWCWLDENVVASSTLVQLS